jgi:amino acid adenylation domain-containing protein/FkbM family methyltransferase
LKAGGAYVPVDTQYPPERIAYTLSDSGCAVVVTEQSLAAQLPETSGQVVRLDSDSEMLSQQSRANPRNVTLSENLAYVIYTSGSAGKPKATMIQHRSVINLATTLSRTVYDGLGSPLRVSVNAPLAFDASVKQLVRLIYGDALCIVPENVRVDGRALADFCARENLDVLDCTPALVNVVLASGFTLADIQARMMLIGGEALERRLWEQMGKQSGRSYFNVYGPTECTVDATASRITSDSERAHCGRALDNVEVYVCDARQRLVPVGVAGELYIGGAGVGRGYLNRPDLTAERFVPHPYSNRPGARLYRTGDLVRYLEDGELEYLGRLDNQVKIRGYRIELGEIEAVCKEHPAVQEAVVLAREDVPGEKRLVAYVVPKPKSMATIRGRARYKLPNGLAIVHQNRNETDYLYDEIFEKRVYLQHGLTLPAGACIFDVGANIGMFTLFVTHQRPDARIYAFEPIKPIFETLRLNVELYGGRVKLFPFGLSDEQRVETFTYYPNYSMMSGLSDYARPDTDLQVIKRYLSNQQRSEEARNETSEVATILEHADELLSTRFESETYESQLSTISNVIRQEQIERIDLLKIDVQRAELNVLQGIEPEHWEIIRQVVMEVHDAPGEESEGRTLLIAALLRERGFETIVEQDELLQGTDRYNLYAVRPAGNSLPASREEQDARPSFDKSVARLFSVQELRQHLKQKLPEFMLPTSFVTLDELPLTRNGKIDRRKLPAPETLQQELESTYVPPRTEAERIIAAIWRDLLHLEKVGLNDNFFELGGHSLLVVQAHSRLQKAFSLEVSMLDIFQHPTISKLAEHLSRKTGEPVPGRSLANINARAQKQRESIQRQQQAMKERKLRS